MSYYYLKEVDFMLTHEELMEKCRELCVAANLLLNAMCENDYIYNPHLVDHEYYMDEMVYTEESMLSIYLENRDSISVEDAEEIIRTIVVAGTVEGFALGTDKNTPNSQLFNNILTFLKYNAN